MSDVPAVRVHIMYCMCVHVNLCVDLFVVGVRNGTIFIFYLVKCMSELSHASKID
jgi:hypothetical protein